MCLSTSTLQTAGAESRSRTGGGSGGATRHPRPRPSRPALLKSFGCSLKPIAGRGLASLNMATLEAMPNGRQTDGILDVPAQPSLMSASVQYSCPTAE